MKGKGLEGEGCRVRVKGIFLRRPHRRPLYFVVLLGDPGPINVTYVIISSIVIKKVAASL